MAARHDATVTAPTILVVDDYDAIRLLLREQLQRKGYRVIEASDGEQAVEAASRECQSLRLVLMDINLPGVDGLTATQRIREIAEMCDVPIVACTARSAPDERAQALAAGCTEVVAKPINKETVEAILTKYFPDNAAAGDAAGEA